MGAFTPLDISALEKKQSSDGTLNVILIILSLATAGVVGFIVYLFVTQY